jgi:hypothetical protein
MKDSALVKRAAVEAVEGEFGLTFVSPKSTVSQA